MIFARCSPGRNDSALQEDHSPIANVWLGRESFLGFVFRVEFRIRSSIWIFVRATIILDTFYVEFRSRK